MGSCVSTPAPTTTAAAGTTISTQTAVAQGDLGAAAGDSKWAGGGETASRLQNVTRALLLAHCVLCLRTWKLTGEGACILHAMLSLVAFTSFCSYEAAVILVFLGLPLHEKPMWCVGAVACGLASALWLQVPTAGSHPTPPAEEGAELSQGPRVLPESFYWPLVSNADRAEGMKVLQEEPTRWAQYTAHRGNLLLGVVRENLLTPNKRGVLMSEFRANQAWRDQGNVDQLARDPLPVRLRGIQVCSAIYGYTAGGLPVVVIAANEVERALLRCEAVGVTPDDFARTRVWALERTVAAIADGHAAGRGNGQSVLILSMRDLSFSIKDIKRLMPFYRSSLVDVALRYNGIAKVVYLIHPPSWFRMLWLIAYPLLPAETRSKIAVVADAKAAMLPENCPAQIAQLTTSSLPFSLGGCIPDDAPATWLVYRAEDHLSDSSTEVPWQGCLTGLPTGRE